MTTWMNRSKQSEAARHAARAESRQKAGNCIRCGLAFDPRSVQLCTKHLEAQRLKRREAWRAKHPKARRNKVK